MHEDTGAPDSDAIHEYERERQAEKLRKLYRIRKYGIKYGGKIYMSDNMLKLRLAKDDLGQNLLQMRRGHDGGPLNMIERADPEMVAILVEDGHKIVDLDKEEE